MVNQGSHQPTVNEQWPDDVEVAMFVDESGTVPKHRRHAPSNERWVTVVGVEFPRDDYFQRLVPKLSDFKKKWWPPNGEYQYSGPRFPESQWRRVVLHWSDIRKKRGPFSAHALSHAPEEFRKALQNVLQILPFRLHAVTIDLKGWRDMIDFAGIDDTWLIDPYHVAFRRLLSEFTQSLQSRRVTGAVYVESRGASADTTLLLDTQAYTTAYRGFERIRYLYFPTKWSERMNNKASWGALEIADLCAGIVRHHHVTEQPSPEWHTIQEKYATRKREIVIPS